MFKMGAGDSSVSIVPDYILDNCVIGVRSPAEAKYISSSLCVQASCDVHPPSYPMGTRDPFPEVSVAGP